MAQLSCPFTEMSRYIALNLAFTRRQTKKYMVAFHSLWVVRVQAAELI